LIPLARARILRAVMKSVSVFEHEVISEPLSDGEKNTLERLRDSSGKKLFDVGWRETRATSFVGVVQLPQTTLQVLPKMYRRILDGRDGPPGRPSPTDAARPAVAPYLPDAKEREATANLLFLLSYTRKLDVTEPEISRLTDQRAPFSEILFWVFAHRLWDAVQREVLRGYVTIEDRLDVLKGRWLVAAQAGRPDGWRRDRFDVAYDEFTEDNLPNRLFKATVHRLSRWSQWTDTRRHLTQLRAVFADVADVTPQPHDFDEAGHWMERYRRRIGERHLYRPLLKLAQMFWTGTGPQHSPGRTETFAFLFDMNQLFEEFIAEFIRRELREVWQSRRWTFHAQSGTRYLLCDETGNNRFKLVPHIRFEAADGITPSAEWNDPTGPECLRFTSFAIAAFHRDWYKAGMNPLLFGNNLKWLRDAKVFADASVYSFPC
jgi:5-methylcytosine-specific restriction enzyme subunit McrC